MSGPVAPAPERGTGRLRLAVYKFSSCDGCQLALLNAGQALLTLSELVEWVWFAEAGIEGDDREVDVAFVEGSVSTPAERERIRRIRQRTRLLVAMGACATSGGLQALRRLGRVEDWTAAVYARPQYIQSLHRAHPLADEVEVDLELWGCPVDTAQMLAAVRSLLSGVLPVHSPDAVCLECKRRQGVCVMVTRGEPCMGPLTHTGCGALCPRFGRGCYGCYGPVDHANTNAVARRFAAMGLLPEQIRDGFLGIHNQAPAFAAAADAAGEHGGETPG